MDGTRVKYKDSTNPTKLVLYFRRLENSSNIYIKVSHHCFMSFTIMSPLINYYLRQAKKGGKIGPIYSVPPFLQRDMGYAAFCAVYGVPSGP
jgi:hypothetical protein